MSECTICDLRGTCPFCGHDVLDAPDSILPLFVEGDEEDARLLHLRFALKYEVCYKCGRPLALCSACRVAAELVP